MKKKSRNPEEIELLDMIFSEVKFFQDIKDKLPEDAYHALLRRSKYEFFKKEDVLFREGKADH